MNSKLVILVFAILIMGTSCKKEQSCNENVLSEAIIGKWQVKGDKSGPVEFMEDGRLLDEESVLHGLFTDENGFSIEGPFIYNTINNERLEIEKVEEDGSSFPSFTYVIDDFNCEEITMTVKGYDIKTILTRS